MFETTAVDPNELADTDEFSETTVHGWSIPALVVGLALVATAISGLLNELPATEHPLWIVPAAGMFAMCLTVIVRTAKSLFAATT